MVQAGNERMAVTRAYQIRAAVSADAEAIARLIGELGYRASFEDTRARLERLLQADQGMGFARSTTQHVYQRSLSPLSEPVPVCASP